MTKQPKNTDIILSDENQLIISDNKYCKFITKDQFLFDSLRNHLSFKAVGVEYTAAFRNGWNGVTYLMNKKGSFLLGLLNEACKFLDSKNIVYKIIDKRFAIQENIEIDISEKLKFLELVPREHQIEILDAAIKNKRGIIRSCTSSGKTLSSAMITAKFNKPTNIYVIGLDLLKQFHNLFSSIFDEPIGFIGNGICEVHRINIISVWTLGRILKGDNKEILFDYEIDNEKELEEDKIPKVLKALEDCKVHQIDESHICGTQTIETIYKNINPERIYGFSGTPFRDDNTDLLIKGILGEQIVNISSSRLIESGLLPKPIIVFKTVPKMKTSNNDSYQTIYKEYVVENEIRNKMIIDSAKYFLSKGYTPLVLFRQIKHGKILFEMMKEENINCELLSGADSLDKRIETKNKITNSEIDLIIASTIFDIGIDIPKLSALILAGPNKSTVSTTQKIGRILRPFPNKKFCAVIDFYDQIKFLKNHSKIRYEIYSSENGFQIHPSKEMINE